MKKIISFNLAVRLSIMLFSLVLLFHLSIIVGIVMFDYAPLDFLWGGRMKTKEELLRFEVISMVTMILCLFIVLMRAGRLKIPALSKAAGILLWLLAILFILNTAGNLLAQTTFEKSFAILTALGALLCIRLALGPGNEA